MVNKNSAHCLNNKTKENSVSKSKHCTKKKLELEITLGDLGSAKLIKLLLKQGHINEEVGYVCTANWNGIQNEKLDSRKLWKINGKKYPN